MTAFGRRMAAVASLLMPGACLAVQGRYAAISEGFRQAGGAYHASGFLYTGAAPTLALALAYLYFARRLVPPLERAIRSQARRLALMTLTLSAGALFATAGWMVYLAVSAG